MIWCGYDKNFEKCESRKDNTIRTMKTARKTNVFFAYTAFNLCTAEVSNDIV